MTSAFSWQNSISLCPASFSTPKATFVCYSRCYLTSYFCIPVPYNEKDIFWRCQFQKFCRPLQNHSTSASSALLVGAQAWITVILNGVPWKSTEIILSFLRLHPSTAFWALLLTMMAISSKGFLSTVVDILVISVKFTHSSPFQFADS